MSEIKETNADKLLKEFIKSPKVTQEDLMQICSLWNWDMKQRAFQKLKEKDWLNNSDLVQMILYEEALRIKAWEELKERNPTDEELYVIATAFYRKMPDEIRHAVASMLIEQTTNSDRLVNLITGINIEDIKEQAGQKILEKYQKWSNLRAVFVFVPALKEKADKMMEQQRSEHKE